MKEQIVIIGAGVHAKVVIDLLQENNEHIIAGCIDNNVKKGNKILDVSVIGNDHDIVNIYKEGIQKVFIAVGNNKVRHKLYKQLEQIGFEFINVISKHASISSHAVLGKGVVVMPGAVVNVHAHISDNVIINTNSSVDHDTHIGMSCHIAPGCSLSGNVYIGDRTHIGTGTSVIDGIRINKDCVIGAGSVVVRNIEDHVVAYGVPAKKIRDNK